MSTGIIILLSIVGVIIIFGYISLKRMKSTTQVENNKKIIILTDKNFSAISKNSILLIDFWADWCMPCKVLAPIINEVADEVDENIKICKINVDEQRNLASKFSVRSIPTLVILKNGKEVNRFVGVKPKHFLIKQLNLIK